MHVVYFCLFTCFYAVNHLGTSESIGERDYFEEALTLNTSCNNHNECGLYERCSNKKCRCISNDYIATDDKCILRKGKFGDECTVQSDCKASFTHCGSDKTCQCHHGYLDVEQDCVLETDDDRCYNGKKCSKSNFICENKICVCPREEYYLQGTECIPEHGIIGDICTVNRNCKILNSVCHNQKCECDPRFYQQGYECVPIDGYEAIIRAPRHYIDSNYKPVDYPCNDDRDCDHRMWCETYTHKCACRPGFLNIQNQCQLIHSLPPEFVNPRHTGPAVHNNPDSLSAPFTWVERHNGNPYGLQYGALGHPCQSSTDCHLHYLYCNPSTKLCDCDLKYELEDGYCVQHITSELKSGMTTSKVKSTVKTMINHGNPCGTNSDCYHEGLVCNQYDHRCICAYPYYEDGNYCVSQKSGESPTSYQPYQPPKLITSGSSSTRMVNHGNHCRRDSDCYHEGLICSQTTYRCTCAHHYQLVGNYCVPRSTGVSPVPHNPYQPPIQVTGGNYVKRMISHGNSCRTNSDCYHEGLICNPSTYQCICAQHYYLDGNYCVSQSSVYPTPHNPRQPPTRITGSNSVKRMINHGNPCRTNSNCYHEGLICNLSTNRCICARHYYLEGNYCVSQSSVYPTPHNPRQPPTRITGSNSVKLMVHHGRSCRTNSDCYHDGLICNPSTYRCICAQHYYLQGDYCVFQTIDSHPAIYNPTQRPSFPHPYIHQSPPRQVHRPYYQPKPYHTHPQDGYSQPFDPYQSHMVSRPEQGPIFVPKISGVTSRGTDHCTSDISCTSPFTYCNKALGVCDCMTGYSKVGQNCVPEHVGRINDVCNSDSQCSYSHSHCYQQRCQCAHSFIFLNGMCIPENSYLREQCNSFLKCETSDAECDTGSNRCVCKNGYSRYIQSCRPDGEAYGRCSGLNTCNQQDLTCERSTARCKCKEGYVESGFICHPLTFTNNNYIS